MRSTPHDMSHGGSALHNKSLSRLTFHDRSYSGFTLHDMSDAWPTCHEKSHGVGRDYKLDTRSIRQEMSHKG